jgi:hypothetical protein
MIRNMSGQRVFRVPSAGTLMAIVGLLIGALGILIQFAAAPELFGMAFGVPFPPGLIYIVGAVVIVWLDQRSVWSPMAAVALSAWIVLGGLLAGDLTANLTAPDPVLVAVNVVMVLGLLASIVAGIVAVASNMRARPERLPHPLSARNPRRPFVVATFVGLVLAGATLAVAERMDFQGPGPIPFVLLAFAVAFVRGRYVIGLALVLSIVYLGAVFSNPEPIARLANPSDVIGFASTVSHSFFLAMTIIAGIAANISPTQRVAPLPPEDAGAPLRPERSPVGDQVEE